MHPILPPAVRRAVLFHALAAFAPAAVALDTTQLPLPLTLPVTSPAAPAGKPAESQQATRFAEKSERRRAASTAGALRAEERAARVTEMSARLAALRRAKALGLGADAGYAPDEVAVTRLAELRASSGDAWHIEWSDATGSLAHVMGRNLDGAPRLTADDALPARAGEFLQSIGTILNLRDPGEELRMRHIVRDRHGFRGVRFDQQFAGLTVWGRDVLVRFDPNGDLIGLSSHHIPSPTGAEVQPRISEAEARAIVTREHAHRVPGAGESRPEEAELLFYPQEGAVRLAWRVRVSAGLRFRDDAFVDAQDGVVFRWESLVRDGTTGPITGSGVDLSGATRPLDLYEIDGTAFMIDTSKDMFDAAGSVLPQNGKGVAYVFDARNDDADLFFVTSTNPDSWTGLANAVSASYHASLVFDYYKDAYGRTSIDDAGMNMNLIVNFRSDFNNAFWNGQFMVFGNGDGTAFSDLAGALDVTAHELSHGVVEHTANLVYEFESGALNEHFADALGISCDHHFDPGANWLVGEDVTTPAIAGDCVRNMEEPDADNVAFDGQQPAHYDQLVELPIDQDHGGVHINSGIPNRAFFLAATGPSMTTVKAREIWYRALSQYLNRDSDFADFRVAVSASAIDLFGDGSAEHEATVAALDAVGIPGGGSTEDPGDLPDIEGNEFLTVIDVATGRALRTPLPLQEGLPVFDVTDNAVGEGGRPSFTDNGAEVVWVGDDAHIYWAEVAGGESVRLSSAPEWWSTAISSNGRFLAATPIEPDPTIFVFDLVEGGGGALALHTQGSGGDDAADNILYADVLEFSVEGEYVLYDAAHALEISGVSTEYWDINMIRIGDGTSFRVFQPLPPTQSVGNPAFAQNSDNRIALDHMQEDGTVRVLGADLVDGDLGVITNNFASLGRPTFAEDDHVVYYQYRTETDNQLWRVVLAEDGITGTGDDQNVINGGYGPVAFTIGTRTTPILNESTRSTWSAGTIALEWQPTDAGDVRAYEFERALGTDGEFELRTPMPIPAASLAVGEGRYRWEDTAPVDGNRATYRIIAWNGRGDRIELGRLEVVRAGAAGMKLALAPITPNPLGSRAQLRFIIPGGSVPVPASVTIFDVRGRRVAVPLDQVLLPGTYELAWDGQDAAGRELPTGVYFVELRAGSDVERRRASIVR